MSSLSQAPSKAQGNVDLLNQATKIAISASAPRPGGRGPQVNSSTINNLIAFLQSRRDVNVLLLLIMRQMGRGEIDNNTGKLLLESLKNLDVDRALTLLGYVKWAFETLTARNITVNRNLLGKDPSFMDLVKAIS
ncbi:hypothetical protein GWK48_10585 [Metallosphaera tengchongensis]|uniref:Uncharacterized protein n=1 Tax=Metallosphaera tengchongensis TaxID=1532350 RepID=A0A6N0NX53_9CREN|nr:hypothetical protein [Metallosphaera tengchongensis]QKR00775.1 hypothetical protein GWK48_10585 [Metallosphaera tengchongensis]